LNPIKPKILEKKRGKMAGYILKAPSKSPCKRDKTSLKTTTQTLYSNSVLLKQGNMYLSIQWFFFYNLKKRKKRLLYLIDAILNSLLFEN
jgi:hypothetical protein